MAIAGKVSIVPKGEWQSTEVYTRLDLVTYNRNAYLSLKNSTGIQPINTEYWMLLIENVANTEIEELQTQIDDIVEDIADIINGTTPVAKSNDSDLLQGFTAEQVGESGVKNLIPYPYAGTTHTESGITWTDNGDGTVTANGTATKSIVFYLSYNLHLKAGTYILSGCPINGTWVGYHIRLTTTNGDNIDGGADYGNGRKWTFLEDIIVRVVISIGAGTTVENLVFKPMLELGSIAHDYVPYHFGGAEDSLKLNGLTAEQFVNNETLLPNGYFKDPINSSGKTEWTGAGTPIIDGWVTSSAAKTTVNLIDTGLKIANSWTNTGNKIVLRNDTAILLEKGTYTLSMKIVEMVGTWYYTFGSNIKITTGTNITTFAFDSEQEQTIQIFKNSSETDAYITIEWIKLEPGHIATPFVPPNKEVEKLKCGATVGDAESVNGFHIYGSLTDIGCATTSTLSEVYTAMAYPSMITFNSSHMTDPSWNFPTVNGSVVITKISNIRGWLEYQSKAIPNHYVMVITDDTGLPTGTWVNIADGGNADTVNGYHADNLPYVPLDGSVAMSGANLQLNNGYGQFYADNNMNTVGAQGVLGDGSSARWLRVYNPNVKNISEALQLVESNGVTNTILHTGNSKPIIISSTAPTDTSALWYDTANKVCKYYKDGAWQQ